MFKAFAAAVVICGATLVATAAPAVAAEPSVAWEASLDNEVTPSQLFGHADGKVTAAACGAPSGDTVQARTYAPGNSAGSAQDVANNSGPRLYACTGQSTLGKDGTLYASGVQNGQPRLLAYKDGQLKWSKTFPAGCDDVYSLTMGVNGNVYGVVSCNGSYRLVGYTPEVAAGSTEPSVPLDVAITGQVPGYAGDRLAAYGDGLVVQLANGVQFFSYSGSTNGPVIIPNFGTTADRTIASDTNGRTFYPVAANNTQQSLCGIGNPNPSIMRQIQATAPDGPAWAHQLPECTHVISLRPSLNGGAVAELYQEHTNGGVGPAVRKLVSLDASGTQLWEVLLEANSMGTYNINHSFGVTIRGDVLFQHTYYTTGDSSINARRANIALISGATGQFIAHKEFMGETQGYIVHGNITVAATGGRVYVVLSRCNWDSCGSDKKLYAIDFRGVELDFPRGAVLKYDEPWRNYVALGDSYSAAMGAGSYTAPTEANGCYRSQNAYAKLLNGSPKYRLNLTSFVACSGATTEDVINGKNGEPSQLDALNTDTDLVTLSIGGNDMGFVEYAKECVFWGHTCDGQTHTNIVNNIHNVLPLKLDALFNQIRSRVSPQTRVLIVGYPWMISLDDRPITWPNCAYLSPSEKAAAIDVVTQLNEALHDAATKTGQFEFVDPNYLMSPFKGHELCHEGNYFNGLVIWPENEGFTFHPNREGQQAYRQVIQTYLAS